MRATGAIAATTVLLALALPAGAQEIDSEKRCVQALKDVEDAQQAEPEIGDKATAQLETMKEVIKSLCERKNFKDADTLLNLARGMIASE